MAELDGKLYIITGRMHKGSGGGGLYVVDPAKPRNDDQVIGGWENATNMTAFGGKLYITCGKMGGCGGDQRLYVVDPKKPRNDEKVGTGTGWSNATCLAWLEVVPEALGLGQWDSD